MSCIKSIPVIDVVILCNNLENSLIKRCHALISLYWLRDAISKYHNFFYIFHGYNPKPI